MQPVSRARRRQGSAPLWSGMILAVLAVAGVGWFVYNQMGLGATDGQSSAPATAPESNQQRNAMAGEPLPTASTVPRGNEILTCTAKDGSTFYTNAHRCEEADLNNRVNVVSSERPESTPRRECLGTQPGGERVHSFLAICREPFNEAIGLEKLLSEAENPAQSRSARRYCELITQGVQAGCMATNAQFCFLDICQQLRQEGGS